MGGRNPGTKFDEPIDRHFNFATQLGVRFDKKTRTVHIGALLLVEEVGSLLVAGGKKPVFAMPVGDIAKIPYSAVCQYVDAMKRGLVAEEAAEQAGEEKTEAEQT